MTTKHKLSVEFEIKSDQVDHDNILLTLEREIVKTIHEDYGYDVNVKVTSLPKITPIK